MPSLAFQVWSTTRAARLDEIEAAHRSIGGAGPGRRTATQQLNQAYAVLLSAQFQGFCRDLHSECGDTLIRLAVQPAWQRAVESELLWNRKLDRGNPNPGNLGADFNRLGIGFWRLVEARHARNTYRKRFLEELSEWRNAIAHQDFNPVKLGGSANLRLRRVRHWRSVCNALAATFDDVMRDFLQSITGVAPW